MSSAVILMIPSSVSSSSEKRWLKAFNQPLGGACDAPVCQDRFHGPGTEFAGPIDQPGVDQQRLLVFLIASVDEDQVFEPVGVGLDELDCVVAPIAGVVALVLYLRVDGGVLQHFLLVAFEASSDPRR